MAKAQEMLKDPQYLAAARAKVAELEAKAKAKGLLDAHGQPVTRPTSHHCIRCVDLSTISNVNPTVTEPWICVRDPL